MNVLNGLVMALDYYDVYDLLRLRQVSKDFQKLGGEKIICHDYLTNTKSENLKNYRVIKINMDSIKQPCDFRKCCFEKVYLKKEEKTKYYSLVLPVSVNSLYVDNIHLLRYLTDKTRYLHVSNLIDYSRYVRSFHLKNIESFKFTNGWKLDPSFLKFITAPCLKRIWFDGLCFNDAFEKLYYSTNLKSLFITRTTLLDIKGYKSEYIEKLVIQERKEIKVDYSRIIENDQKHEKPRKRKRMNLKNKNTLNISYCSQEDIETFVHLWKVQFPQLKSITFLRKVLPDSVHSLIDGIQIIWMHNDCFQSLWESKSF